MTRPLRPEVLARAIPQIERFLPAGDPPLVPLAPGEVAPVLFRFPSPTGLLEVAATGDFELTLPGIDAAFMGDLQTVWDYPWVREFGSMALLDGASLGVHRVTARDGWFVCDGAQVVPGEACVHVVDRAMAEALRPGMDRAAAQATLDPMGHADSVTDALRRCRDYADALPQIEAHVRELRAEFEQHPDRVRGHLRQHGLSMDDLDRPTFELTPEQRAALMSW